MTSTAAKRMFLCAMTSAAALLCGASFGETKAAGQVMPSPFESTNAGATATAPAKRPKAAPPPPAVSEAPVAAAADMPLAASMVPGIRGVDPDLAAMMARCAPTVHPETMSAIVSAESRGHQFAIADAGPVHLPWSKRKSMVRSLYPGSHDEAVRTALQLIKAGHTVSLGVAQVNDRNLARMGVSISEVFDVCTNLAVGGRILTDFYTRAVARFGAGEGALHAALSAYNSGDWVRGAKDGYVNLVYRQLGKPLAVRTDRAGTAVPRMARAMPTTEAERPTRQFTMTVTDFSAAAETY